MALAQWELVGVVQEQAMSVRVVADDGDVPGDCRSRLASTRCPRGSGDCGERAGARGSGDGLNERGQRGLCACTGCPWRVSVPVMASWSGADAIVSGTMEQGFWSGKCTVELSVVRHGY